MMHRVALLILSALMLLVGAAPAMAHHRTSAGGSFIDDDGSVHEGDIEAIRHRGITMGCNERQIRYCPDRGVTRGQMAAFLSRSLRLPSSSQNHFSDDNGHLFEDHINRIADRGITRGCNPPANTRFCPDRQISRAEMATMLVRAFPNRVPDRAPNAFRDDNGNVHESYINRIAAANITVGCNPPDNTRYCPSATVTRGQMASFLKRALRLDAIDTPRRINERVSRFTTYHDCCQTRVHNIQLMADTIDGYVVMPGEVFSIEALTGARTESQGYRSAPCVIDGETRSCPGGGTSQFATTTFNAIFYAGYEEVDHRPHTHWYPRYPQGIEATLYYRQLDVAFRNDTNHPVTVRTSHTSTSVTVELWGYVGGWQMTGYHPRGSTRSVIQQVDGSSSDRVTYYVNGSAPGYVSYGRDVYRDGVHHHNDNWGWTYGD